MHTLERFHIWLGVQAVGAGTVVAAVWWAVAGRAGRTGGRVLLAATAAASILVVRHYVYATPAVAAALIVATVGLLSNRADWPVVGLMATTSLVGVWVAVPDTEAPLIALGVVAVPTVAGWARPTIVVDRLAAIALIIGAAWIGSAGRVEMIGGIGCVGLLATLPAFSIEAERADRPRWWWLLGAHAAVVVVSARVLTRVSPATALVGVASIVVAALVAGVLVDRGGAVPFSERERRAPGSPPGRP